MDQVRPSSRRQQDAGPGSGRGRLGRNEARRRARRGTADEEAPKKQANWMLPVAINLGIFAVYLLIAPPAWIVMNPIEAAPVEEQTTDMRLAMYLQAMRVDAYRGRNGELPPSLEDAGSAVPGVEYSMIGANRYELIATIGTEVVRYDSSESANAWVGPDAASKLLGGT